MNSDHNSGYVRAVLRAIHRGDRHAESRSCPRSRSGVRPAWSPSDCEQLMPVLMHISDLHRSLEEPISNAELVAALERDSVRHADETPSIGRPDAVIVSGDIVRGAKLGAANADQVILAQYERAEEFLAEVADLFLDGDRSRVVICPGNHDVDWNLSYASMQPVPREKYPRDVIGALSTPGSNLRWNWSECALFEIVDAALYASRMEKYWDFLHRFYKGFDLLHIPSASDDPLLAELFGKRVLVAAFNSCSDNDCFKRSGAINPEAVSRMHLDLLEREWEYALRIAVWHHNTTGPPSADDYLNVDQIQAMIDFGFRVGLHGHQHRSEVAVHELRLPEYQSMAVLGAGSLAAGQPELPRGANRQYSLLKLQDDFLGARLHLREIESGMQFVPRRLNDFGGRSYHDIAWKPVKSPAGTMIDTARLNESRLVLEAEAALKDEQYQSVLELLSPFATTLQPYGRQILMDAAEGAKAWQLILDTLGPARLIDEVGLRTKAAVQLNEFNVARGIVEGEGSDLGMEPPQRQDMLDWIAGEEAIA